MPEEGWIIKKGKKHLHGYSVINEKVVKPLWLDKRTGALVFSRSAGAPIAAHVGGVLIRE